MISYGLNILLEMLKIGVDYGMIWFCYKILNGKLH